jgi:hypothetical protein
VGPGGHAWRRGVRRGDPGTRGRGDPGWRILCIFMHVWAFLCIEFGSTENLPNKAKLRFEQANALQVNRLYGFTPRGSAGAGEVFKEPGGAPCRTPMASAWRLNFGRGCLQPPETTIARALTGGGGLRRLRVLFSVD